MKIQVHPFLDSISYDIMINYIVCRDDWQVWIRIYISYML